ncbi:hypothetical protein RFI_29574, partial [Reticulomyxa filosa]
MVLCYHIREIFFFKFFQRYGKLSYNNSIFFTKKRDDKIRVLERQSNILFIIRKKTEILTNIFFLQFDKNSEKLNKPLHQNFLTFKQKNKIMGGQIGADEDLLAQTSSFKEEKNDNSKAQRENEKLNLTKEKLKRYYQSQDKLAPLFDDPEQSIDTCYIQLALLTQQQFQQQKDKM